VQACYEYKSGSLDFFDIQSGIVSDNAYTSGLANHLRRGDLLIVDLGYFSMKTFHQTVSICAFFLSRLLVGTTLICHETMKPINLPEIFKEEPDGYPANAHFDGQYAKHTGSMQAGMSEGQSGGGKRTSQKAQKTVIEKENHSKRVSFAACGLDLNGHKYTGGMVVCQNDQAVLQPRMAN
jgi:hypothetical protein